MLNPFNMKAQLIPRAKTKPLKANIRSSTKNPQVFAMIMFLPTAPMTLNKDDAV